MRPTTCGAFSLLPALCARTSCRICRRAELNRLIQHYELGVKPPKPSVVTGSVTNTLISVTAGDGTTSISFTATVQLPTTGSAPYPALIGVGGSSLNNADLTGVARITLNNNVCERQCQLVLFLRTTTRAPQRALS